MGELAGYVDFFQLCVGDFQLCVGRIGQMALGMVLGYQDSYYSRSFLLGCAVFLKNRLLNRLESIGAWAEQKIDRFIQHLSVIITKWNSLKLKQDHYTKFVQNFILNKRKITKKSTFMQSEALL